MKRIKPVKKNAFDWGKIWSFHRKSGFFRDTLAPQTIDHATQRKYCESIDKESGKNMHKGKKRGNYSRVFSVFPRERIIRELIYINITDVTKYLDNKDFIPRREGKLFLIPVRGSKKKLINAPFNNRTLRQRIIDVNSAKNIDFFVRISDPAEGKIEITILKCDDLEVQFSE